MSPLATGGPVSAPSFDDVHERLALGQIETITVVPPDVLQQMAPTAPTAPPRAAAANPGGGGSGSDRNVPVNRPNQNPGLKAAWAATGIASIYKAGSPYHDPNAPRGKRILADDEKTRICLPMALKGKCYEGCGGKHTPLTPTEEKRVAAEGGLTIV